MEESPRRGCSLPDQCASLTRLRRSVRIGPRPRASTRHRPEASEALLDGPPRRGNRSTHSGRTATATDRIQVRRKSSECHLPTCAHLAASPLARRARRQTRNGKDLNLHTAAESRVLHRRRNSCSRSQAGTIFREAIRKIRSKVTSSGFLSWQEQTFQTLIASYSPSRSLSSRLYALPC